MSVSGRQRRGGASALQLRLSQASPYTTEFGRGGEQCVAQPGEKSAIPDCLVYYYYFFWAHQHKAAGLKIKLSKIKWLQRRFIR